MTSFYDCIRCMGTGRYDGAEPRPCSACKGLGMIEDEEPDDDPYYEDDGTMYDTEHSELRYDKSDQ